MDNKLSLKQQNDFESRIGKTWLLKGECYQFTGYTIIGEQLVISTDRKVLMYPVSEMAAFLKALLPVQTEQETRLDAVKNRAEAQSQSDLSVMRQAMMAQFNMIQATPTPENLLRAQHMGKVAATYMNLVKTEISLHKLKS